MEKNKKKKKRLPYCIICGGIDRSRLVTRNTLMDWPPYVICSECAGEANNSYKKEIQNENR